MRNEFIYFLNLKLSEFLTTEDRVILKRRMNASLEKCLNIRYVSLPLARIPVVTQFLEHIVPHVHNIQGVYFTLQQLCV
jgi:hypothetical protein